MTRPDSVNPRIEKLADELIVISGVNKHNVRDPQTNQITAASCAAIALVSVASGHGILAEDLTELAGFVRPNHVLMLSGATIAAIFPGDEPDVFTDAALGLLMYIVGRVESDEF